MTTDNQTAEPNYVTWLKALDVGSTVKIGDCTSNHCSCNLYTVQGKLRLFEIEALVVADSSCSTRFFDPINGKELGNRKGQYKSGYLAQVTQADLDMQAKKEADKEKEKAIDAMIARADELLEKHLGKGFDYSTSVYSVLRDDDLYNALVAGVTKLEAM
jgi:hypothetical protein